MKLLLMQLLELLIMSTAMWFLNQFQYSMAITIVQIYFLT